MFEGTPVAIDGQKKEENQNSNRFLFNLDKREEQTPNNLLLRVNHCSVLQLF